MSFWIFVAGVAAIATVLLVVWSLFLTRNEAVKTGTQALVGRTGVASTELAPEGTVTVDRETWTATTDGELISAGDKVEVTGVDGVVLQVTKRPSRQRHA